MADRDGDDSFWIEQMRGPADNPTDSYRHHLARIDQFVTLWHDGKLSIDQKRRAISDENRAFYGPNCPKRLLWPPH